MTRSYNSQYGDTLDVPFGDTCQNFSILPKYPSLGLFTLKIIAPAELQDTLIRFFKEAEKDRCCVTATHDLDGTSLELTVIDHQVKACAEGRRFELIATMKDRDDRKYSSAIQSKQL
ncbi:hypothetical protein [Aeromonas sp. BIGb0445]|uniref:hypothetical protein n=1 Tax=Aeromonas sp. BIGb0445 TaxID=2940593 RepID=UPI00216704F1|nr:hypothetical protein [Aeromonas sp. BIGb0445]MCS3459117.1 hypothetical protein [Aeromonas sp. BIGb0445]